MAEETAPTVVVRGSGGVVFTLDVPKSHTMAFERLVEKVNKGELVILEGDVDITPDEGAARLNPPTESADDTPTVEVSDDERDQIDILKDDVPDGTIDDVTTWVEENEDERKLRSIAALEVEQASSHPRKSLIAQLTEG